MRRNRVFFQKNVSLIVGDLGERDIVPATPTRTSEVAPSMAEDLVSTWRRHSSLWTLALHFAECPLVQNHWSTGQKIHQQRASNTLTPSSSFLRRLVDSVIGENTPITITNPDKARG